MMHNDFTYREFRATTVMTSRAPIFIDCAMVDTPIYQHHVSMYAITAQDADIQRKIGNTKNRNVIHYSGELIIDTDNIETAEKVGAKLIQLGYQFEAWKLNNFKFYLKRADKDIPSSHMCYQDREFVKNNFMDCNVDNGLDTGIYSHPFHICRAKGAVHEKTGLKSILVEKHEGPQKISTNNVELNPLKKPIAYNYDTSICEWKSFQSIVDFAAGKRGNNHLNIWALAKDLKKFVSYIAAEELIKMYAKSLDYSEEKALRALNQVYKEEGHYANNITSGM